jgi:hypothetical protein
MIANPRFNAGRFRAPADDTVGVGCWGAAEQKTGLSN